MIFGHPFQPGWWYDIAMIWHSYGNGSMVWPCTMKMYFFLFALRLLPAHFTWTSFRSFLKQWVSVSCSHDLWIIHYFIDLCLNHLLPIQRALINISYSLPLSSSVTFPSTLYSFLHVFSYKKHQNCTQILIEWANHWAACDIIMFYGLCGGHVCLVPLNNS